jgi:hypothetical protein
MAHVVVEQALNVTRLAKTAVAARRYDRSATPPRSADNQVFWNMRQAMSLDPRLGKALSRLTFRTSTPLAWQIPSQESTRFVNLNEVDRAVAGIRRDGFYVFDRVADPDVVTAIRDHAERVACVARGAGTPPAPYPRREPLVGRYDIDEAAGLACPEVQEFATDPLLALVAQRYLNQPVIMDEVAFWWTTTKKAEDADLNAQLFHQDRDRLAFLKFFMYVTDVTPETGPHVYLRGSHRDIPWSLRNDGRMTDDAVRAAGLWHNVTELTGGAGTLMAVDTIGLHKGKTPIASDRLAIENEFSTSLFGTAYEIPIFSPTELTRMRFAQMPYVLQRYAPALGQPSAEKSPSDMSGSAP